MKIGKIGEPFWVVSVYSPALRALGSNGTPIVSEYIAHRDLEQFGEKIYKMDDGGNPLKNDMGDPIVDHIDPVIDVEKKIMIGTREPVWMFKLKPLSQQTMGFLEYNDKGLYMAQIVAEHIIEVHNYPGAKTVIKNNQTMLADREVLKWNVVKELFAVLEQEAQGSDGVDIPFFLLDSSWRDQIRYQLLTANRARYAKMEIAIQSLSKSVDTQLKE